MSIYIIATNKINNKLMVIIANASWVFALCLVLFKGLNPHILI